MGKYVPTQYDQMEDGRSKMGNVASIPSLANFRFTFYIATMSNFGFTSTPTSTQNSHRLPSSPFIYRHTIAPAILVGGYHMTSS